MGPRPQEGGAEHEATCDPDECWILPKAMPFPAKMPTLPPLPDSLLPTADSAASSAHHPGPSRLGRRSGPLLILPRDLPSPLIIRTGVRELPPAGARGMVRQTRQAWTYNREWRGLRQTTVSTTDTGAGGSFHTAPADRCHAGMWV